MKLTVLPALLALLAAGCASEYPYIDAHFGQAYASLIRNQTLDPAAVAHPPKLAPAIGDGPRLDNVLKAHRKAVPQGVSQNVSTGQFQTGSQ